MNVVKKNLQARGHGLAIQESLLKKELEKVKGDIKGMETAALPRDVRKILEGIHQDLFNPALTVCAVKKRCGLRNNNISTVFKRVIGMGIWKYIEGKRMQAAMQLLGYAELEVFLIGAAVGYSYEESFTRAFRRYSGSTPSQYRNELLQRKKNC